MIKLPTCTYLQNNIDVSFIIKVSVHFDNMRMVKKYLYFQLSNKLFYNLLFFQQLFFDHLYGTNKSCCFLSSFKQINTWQETLYHTFQNRVILSSENHSLIVFYFFLFHRMNCPIMFQSCHQPL